MRYLRLLLCCALPLIVFPQQSKQISFRHLTVEHGLSQNSVVSIAQDSIGYLWMATQDGLNKYDGKTFRTFNKQFDDVTRPTFSKLGKTYVDQAGNLWIISSSGNLEKFNRKTEKFQQIPSIYPASCIAQDHQGSYYYGTFGNGLFAINSATKDTLQLFKQELKGIDVYDVLISKDDLYLTTSKGVFEIKDNRLSIIKTDSNAESFSALAISKNQTIWMGSFTNGLFNKTKDITTIKKVTHPDLPSNLNIQDILVDSSQRIWMATYGDGLFILDLSKDEVLHFRANKNNPFALQYDDVLCIYEDYTGTIWLGTDGTGLSYYDEHLKKFNVITNAQTPRDVNVDVVRAIAVDDQKTMWLGTSGKGLTAINESLGIYRTFTQKNSDVSDDRIMSLNFQNGNLWIGHQGEGLQSFDSLGRFTNYVTLQNQTIWKIYPNNDHQFWICTRDSGLILFDTKEGIIKEYNEGNSALISNNIRTIEKGNGSTFWIGTEDEGLFKLDVKTESLQQITAISDKIKSLYFDGNALWVGTNGSGLKRFDPKTKNVKAYDQDDGLPNAVIYGILPAEDNNLWLSCNKGVFGFELVNGKPKIELYGSYNGLQAFEFNTGAYFKSEDGTFYFGGLEGVNWFKPDALTVNKKAPKTVISKFEIFNKEQPLKNNANYRYDKNTMTFTYAGLHFSQPEHNQYKYQLTNLDRDWVSAQNNTTAHYTNLPPNDYEFQVISSNYDGVWNETPATYKFTILKPWYLTNVLKFIYLLLFSLLIYGIFKYLAFRWEIKTQLQLEHSETERLKKLDDFKTKLYTNISHEFRTPLTLISGPIDHQLSKQTLSREDRKELNLVKQNAKRLLKLVNQMVDLSLIDSGQLRLKVAQGNLNVLLKQILAAFQYKAEENHINIISTIQNLESAWYDVDVVEKIVSNLLSNAIKYAPQESDVFFDANRQNDALVMTVINVNKTISMSDFDQLFKRFYQEDIASDGVGVGLALVKELVNASKGSIIANSLDDEKIQFTVTLPIEKESFLISELKTLETAIESEDLILETSETVDSVLVVEDDDDIRSFIVSILQDSFNVIKAKNGKEGIEMAMEHIPDVIVSDIMMPITNGIELCNTLKYNELTSHIPIIILTAKVGEENEIEGLKTGADAYITKPFNSEKLKIRVQKLIENRRKLQKHYSLDFVINPKLPITSTEANFLNRLNAVLEKDITNPEFKSEAFAQAMHMSRTQLHRKLKAIVGMTASEFIRSQRLKLSLKLLKSSDATISEIAYQVGFNTPSYYIKCFKETYGCTPNEYE